MRGDKQDAQRSEAGKMKKPISQGLALPALFLMLASFWLPGAEGAIAAQDVKAPAQNAGTTENVLRKAWSAQEYINMNPVIVIQKYIAGGLSSYSYRATVSPDGIVDFYGVSGTRTEGRRTYQISQDRYQGALRVFDEVNFRALQSDSNPAFFALATVTLFQNGAKKTVDFDHVSLIYVKLMRGLEEQLQIRDLRCPQFVQVDGKSRDSCVDEDQFQEKILRGGK